MTLVVVFGITCSGSCNDDPKESVSLLRRDDGDGAVKAHTVILYKPTPETRQRPQTDITSATLQLKQCCPITHYRFFLGNAKCNTNVVF